MNRNFEIYLYREAYLKNDGSDDMVSPDIFAMVVSGQKEYNPFFASTALVQSVFNAANNCSLETVQTLFDAIAKESSIQLNIREYTSFIINGKAFQLTLTPIKNCWGEE